MTDKILTVPRQRLHRRGNVARACPLRSRAYGRRPIFRSRAG